MADYMNFADLYGAVEKAITQSSGSKRDLAKLMVNMVYLNEICICDDVHPLFWLMDLVDDVTTKDSVSIEGASKAAACNIDATGHGFASGDIIQIEDVVGMTELNSRILVVEYVGANDFTLKTLDGTAVASTGYTAWSSGGTCYHRGTTLAKNFFNIESFAWKDESGQVNPIGFDEMYANTSWMDPDTESKPTKYLLKHYFSTSGTEYPRLIWYTLPDDNYQTRIWGPVRPSPLSSDSDVPVLPFQFHRTIVAGAITRLAENQVQVENQVVWPGIYKMQLGELKSFNRRWWNTQDRSDTRRGPYLA